MYLLFTVSAKMRVILWVLSLFLICQIASGKRFSRCELAKELKKQGFPVDKLPDWVCLVEAESSRDSQKKGPKNRNGSYDWGLFQINDGLWCKDGDTPGRDCNIKCSSLLDDDITVASTCAKFIYKRQGFKAWYGWKNNCKGTLPDLSKCGL